MEQALWAAPEQLLRRRGGFDGFHVDGIAGFIERPHNLDVLSRKSSGFDWIVHLVLQIARPQNVAVFFTDDSAHKGPGLLL